MELIQEPKVVLPEIPDVVDSMSERRDPLDTHAKCETRVSARLVLGPDRIALSVRSDPLIEEWIDHAATDHFNPALLLAETAARTTTLETLHVEFCRRLRKWEVVGPESDVEILPEDLVRERLKGSLEI